MPLNEEHDRFERAVQTEIEQWLNKLHDLDARFPSEAEMPKEIANTRRELVGRIKALALKTWPPQELGGVR